MLSDRGSDSMDTASLEATSHPFVVRIWLEESGEDGRSATWRGHITHVPSGKRNYVHRLADITAFIAPYLESMGVQLDLCRRVRQWLRQQGNEEQIYPGKGEDQKRRSERRTGKWRA